jgi:UDP-N-acetyl-D-glucosamine dehydrogenase
LRVKTSTELVRKIESKEATVGVIGLGYVGLPLVLLFASRGFRVLGFDIDEQKVEALNDGRSYIHTIASERIAEARAAGFQATTDYDRLPEADAVFICVPTPVGPHHEPDLSFIERTAEALSRRLRSGHLIVLESTTYPGTTREVLCPILEKSGLKAGQDFFVAFSPEREDPGNPTFSTANTPKIVAGLTDDCALVADKLYSQVVSQTVRVGSLEVAELAKLLENIYRAVNIALANELKMLCDRMGIDAWEVIDAAATKPFGFTPFYPGPGIGGHCIPVDPYYLTWRAREFGLDTRFIELAGQINTAMPAYVVQRLASELNKHGKCLHGANILCLGVAYKKNVDDLRESPALEVIEILRDHGAEITYHDPFIPALPQTRRHKLDLKSIPLTPETLRSADAVLILTDHDSVDYDTVAEHAALVVDTRNATRSVGRARGNIARA